MNEHKFQFTPLGNGTNSVSKIFNTHVYENWTRLTNSARPEAHTKLNSLDSSVRPEIKIKDSNGKCLEMERNWRKEKR